MLTQVRQSGLQLLNTVPVCSLVGDPLSTQGPGQVLIHPLSKKLLSLLQPQTHNMVSFPKQIMQLQVVRCGDCLMSLYKQNSCNIC